MSAVAASVEFLDITFIEQISLAMWHDLVEAFGRPPHLPAAPSHDDIYAALQSNGAPTNLIDALDNIYNIGTEAGRDAITAAAKEEALDLTSWPKDDSQVDTAVRLVIKSAQDETAREVLVRAQIATHEDHVRNTREYAGRSARAAPGNVRQLRPRLEKELTSRFELEGMGRHLDVRIKDRRADDDDVIIHVVHGAHIRKVLAVADDDKARRSLSYRPPLCDSLHYDPSTGRLRIASSNRRLDLAYRELIGLLFFDDNGFFSGECTCTLRPLQKGRDALNKHDVCGIGAVRLKECLWQRNGRLHWLRRDCFTEIEELKLPFEEGDVLEAKLDIQITAMSIRPVTVTIRAPNRINYRRGVHEELVERYLYAVGIRQLHAPEHTLWSLGLSGHKEQQWRSVFGVKFDVFKRQGILRPVTLAAVEHPDHAAHGSVLQVEPLPSGGLYGVSMNDAVPPRNLTLSDVQGYELHPDGLFQYLRPQLALQGGPIKEVNPGVWLLGDMNLGSSLLRFLFVLRSGGQLPPTLASVYHVPITPPGCPRQGMHELPASYDIRPLMRSIVHDHDLYGRLAANLYAPEEASLIVDPRRGEVWLDGVLLTQLAAGEHPFKFVEVVARANGGIVPEEAIDGYLQGSGAKTTPKQAKNRAKTAIEQSFASAHQNLNRDVNELFKKVKDGYKLADCAAYCVPAPPKASCPAVA